MIRIYFLLIFILVFISASAQVPVSSEPRHHVIFSNKKVRILNVFLAPGDTTNYHLHSTPSVFINLSNTRTGSQLINEQPTYGNSFTGNIYFENLSAPHTRIHRVWNIDTAVFHVIDIELLSMDSGFTQKPLKLSHTQLLTDTPWVRTYKINLKESEAITLHETKRSFVIIALNTAALNIFRKNLPVKGDLDTNGFTFLSPGESLTITNTKKTKASYALLEIR